jgi:ligand-binding sensor domain-containing protein
MRNFFVFAVLGLAAAAAQVYPQKVVTRYSLEDRGLPTGLQWSAEETVTAAGGATWRPTDDGLYRHDPRALERDRTQFFGGQRYLAGAQVTALAPDASGGVWVRTRIGVSHIEFRPMTLEDKAAIFERRIR